MKMELENLDVYIVIQNILEKNLFKHMLNKKVLIRKN